MNKRELAKINRDKVQAYCNKILERPSDFGYHGNLDMFETWSLGPVIEHRDSTLIDQSNAQEIKRIFKQADPDGKNWTITNCDHWAVGWVDHLSMRVYKHVLHTYAPTKILLVWQDIENSLEDYPILNEDDHLEREHNATLDGTEDAAGYFADQHNIDLPDDYASTLYSWFSDCLPSAIESSDDTGGYPSDDELEQAFIALGWL